MPKLRISAEAHRVLESSARVTISSERLDDGTYAVTFSPALCDALGKLSMEGSEDLSSLIIRTFSRRSDCAPGLSYDVFSGSWS